LGQTTNPLNGLGLALRTLGAGCQGGDEGRAVPQAPAVGSTAASREPGKTASATPAPRPNLPAAVDPPSDFEGNDLRLVDPDELASAANTYYQDGQPREAARLLHYAVKDGVPQQDNRACYNALAGHVEAALYWLKVAALDEGVDASWARQDSDLAGLRRDTRWTQLAAYLDACNAYWASSGHVATSLVVPGGYEVGTPIGLVVGLHGLGADPERLVDEDWRELADATGRAIVAVSGTRPTGKHSFAWAEDRERGHQHIQQVLATLSDRVTIDPKDVVLFGFSQGAQMGFEVAMAHPESYRGSLVMSPDGRMRTINEGLAPKAENASQHFVLTCGAAEAPGNVAFTGENAEFARAAGAGVEMKLYEGMSRHSFPPDFFEQFPCCVRFLDGEEKP
jgi:predicted esterase